MQLQGGMERSFKIVAGSPFPRLDVQDLDGHARDLGTPEHGADWMMVVVYRGVHCPICTKYLGALPRFRQRLLDAGVDVAAVSADSQAQLREHTKKLDVNFPLYFGLSVEQMRSLGLYISHPRSPKETDHPFAEPAVFVVNADRTIQIVDISNAPFARPDLERLTDGIEFIRKKDYPIRGTFLY